MKKLCFALGLILMGLGASAQNLNSIFWEVKAPNGAVSHLLGTYHLMGGSYLNEINRAPEAFAQSRAIVLEMLLDSAALGQASLMTIMPGKSIKKMTDSLDYLLLKEKLEPIFGMDLISLDMLKPMVLSTQYAVVLAQNCTPEEARFPGAPLDLHLATEAQKQQKEVIGLETMAEQMAILFDSQSPEEQLEDLLSMVKDSVNAKENTKAIIRSYLNGDLDAMFAVSQEFEESMGDMDALLKDRNLKWMPQLEAELQKGALFVAVGALHLPGEYGLIKLLQDKGYRFTAL